MVIIRVNVYFKGWELIDNNIVKDINLDEVSNLIDYHYNIFGINKDIGEFLYLDIKHEMFNMINLFSLLDDRFEDDIINLFIEDALSLIIYFDILDTKSTESEEKDLQIQCKLLREKVIPIINTKLYYLDLYIWESVQKSRPIQFYLRQKYKFLLNDTFDFITYREKGFDTIIDITYKVKDIDLKVKYEANEILYIKSLGIEKERRENTLLRKIIDNKDSISFFRSMNPHDIEFVIRDIEFIRFKKGETIIKQKDFTKEVYFLVSGSCIVFVDHKNIARIEEKSNIW